MRTNLHHLLEERAVRSGDRPALSHQDVTLDYASVWEQAWRTGAVLADLGVERGDRVAVYLDKRPETVAGIFGASVAGAVFVPVNPALKGAQVAYILGDCDVRVLDHLTPALGVDPRRRQGRARGSPTSCSSTPTARHRTEGEVELHDLGELVGRGDRGASTGRGRSTSTPRRSSTPPGSTGRPKGVVLSPPQPHRRRRERLELPRQPRPRTSSSPRSR